MTPNQLRTLMEIWDNGGEMTTHDVLRLCSKSDLRSMQQKGYIRASGDAHQRITIEGKRAAGKK